MLPCPMISSNFVKKQNKLKSSNRLFSKQDLGEYLSI